MHTLRVLAATFAAAVLPSLRAQVPDLYDPDTIRDVYLQFSQPNYWTLLTNNYVTDTNIAADMTVDGITYPNVGVRFRGNTSYTMLPTQPNQGWEKKSFNIELDWQVASQDIYGYDHLNLNNGFHDPTFLREFLTYMVMRRHGVAPKANFVRLFLNGSLWGLYINVQQPNKDMMKQWFRSNDGNRYRCFPTSGGFTNGRCAYTVLSPNTPASYLAAYQAKQGDGTDLMNMCTVLNAMTTATPQSTLTTVFSVDAFYRYAAVMNACGNIDSYLESGKDHFLYIDEVHGDGTTFPFDLNESWEASTTLAPDYQTTNAFRPGFTKTLQFADWTQRYKAHLKSVVEKTFNPTVMNPLITQYHAMIDPYVQADPKKIYTYAQFTTNLNSSVTIGGGPGGGTLTGLIPYVLARYNFLNTHAYLNAARATLSNLAHSPVSPNPTQPISFTVQASALATGVNLWWRRTGPFQRVAMFDDGLHGDGTAADGTWGVSIAAQIPGSLIDYYVEAVTATGAASYEPFTAEAELYAPHVQIDWPIVASPVVINEFVAQNQNGPVDENSQHEDWVELYNTSNQPVDISGKWLSDSLVVLKYQFPSGTVVPANGVLRVWCDEDGTQGPLHANFKLSASGEAVAFYDSTGLALHDSIEFGTQAADVSAGRLFDGAVPWVTFPAPTFQANNAPGGCGQRTYGTFMSGAHGVAMTASGTIQANTTVLYGLTNGPANGAGLLALSLGGSSIDLSFLGIAEVLLLEPSTLVLPFVIPFDAAGNSGWNFTLTPPAGVPGTRIYAQVLTFGAAGWDSTPSIEITVCP